MKAKTLAAFLILIMAAVGCISEYESDKDESTITFYDAQGKETRRIRTKETVLQWCAPIIFEEYKNGAWTALKTQRLNWEPVVTIVPLSRPTRWDLVYGKKSMQTASSAK